jgi:ABC-2 type transport system permease protein
MTDFVRSVALLLRWNALRLRQITMILLMLQVVLGVGVIYGFAFLVPHITPTVALFFTTGAPSVVLIMLGINIIPQEVAQARINGRYLYVSALPVPRLAPMLAEVLFWVFVQIPGTIVTLFIAILRFHIHLHVSLLVIPAVILVSLTTAALGYALAASIPPPVTSQLASVLGIAVMLFSPINFPLSRLPHWLQDVHHVLPVSYMADLIRGTLTGQYDTARATAFAVLGAWCVAGLVLSSRAAARRG